MKYYFKKPVPVEEKLSRILQYVLLSKVQKFIYLHVKSKIHREERDLENERHTYKKVHVFW